MNNINNNISIFKLSLQAAVACNLQCKYCIVSKNSNTSYIKELQENTNKAILDGSYLNNVKSCFDRLRQDPKKVRMFEIWGQEPTLVLPFFTEKFSDWYDVFSGMKSIMFSTNALIPNFSDTVYDFILKVDRTVQSKDIKLEIQISYDGIAEKDARGGDSDILKNNIINLYKKLNQTKINNIEVHFYIHSVLSNFLIDYFLDSTDNIKYFYDDLNSFYIDMFNNCLNRQVHLGPITLQYMNGSQASTEDGLRFSECCERMERFLQVNKNKYEYFKKFPLDIDVGANALGCVVHNLPSHIRENGYDSLDEYVDAFLNGDENILYNNNTEYCGATIHDLKVMYDGTSISCQNFLFDSYKNGKENNNDDDDNTIKNLATKAAMTNNTQSLNLLTASDEEINKQLSWGVKTIKQNNMAAMTNMIANLMFIMANIGQISNEYLHDLNKIKNHAFMLAALECCYYNLIVATGSSLIHPSSQIRYLCNGLMDKAENMIKLVLEREGSIPNGR